MAFIYKLEHEDGTPADPPTFRSSSHRRPTPSRPSTGNWLRPHRLPVALARCWRQARPRVGSVETLLVSDYDEPRRRVRLRKAITKTRPGGALG